MFFFFSSRRRHTRSLCDWSSDVCSSDLNAASVVVAADDRLRLTVERDDHARRVQVTRQGSDLGLELVPPRPRDIATCANRSEERRVGKECRSRWWRWSAETKTEEWKQQR